MSITIPSTIISGDTLKIEGSLSDYAPVEYTLKLALTGSEAIEITATEVNGAYQLLVSAANTSNYTAGLYDYVLYVTDVATGLEQYSIENGSITIEKRADLAGLGDKRSHYKIVLDNIEAVIEKRATRDQQSYSVGGRSLQRMTVEELLHLRSYYKDRLNAQKRKGKRKTIRWVM